MTSSVEQRINAIYRAESRRILATLLRLLRGDFALAEEALHDAFIAALSQWQRDGIPDNPRAWLVSAGRFKAIDRVRRNQPLNTALNELAQLLEAQCHTQPFDDDETIEDDRLRLIFTCCHPSLSMEARVALTLREVCGLSTEAIAAAFLVSVPTLAQRIVRAKNKIRDAGIPYEVPLPEECSVRLEAVLPVVYLVFNEGYSSAYGADLTQPDLSGEAIRLGRLLLELLPDSEVMGLLALMLLHDARRVGRLSAKGDLIPLEDQDRRLWDREQIREGSELVVKALSSGSAGVYALQAAIAALHAEAPSAEQTDWAEITGLYEVLLRLNPSPIIELNRAVALAMRDGPHAGLQAIESLSGHKELQRYHLFYAAQADLYRRLNQPVNAMHYYQQALEFVQQEPEQRFLQQRLEALKRKMPS